VTAALAEPVDELIAFSESHPFAAERLWNHLLALSADAGSPSELAQRALTKTAGAEQAGLHAATLAGLIRRVESAFRQVAPEVGEQLPLRLPFLQEQWEARGPGLLHNLGRLTEPMLLAEDATIALVQPCGGGGGSAYPPYNLVLFAAVLADGDPRLPEVVRLGWLLAQLNLDLPAITDVVDPGMSEQLGVALLPAALLAAEEVELPQFTPATVELALSAWARYPASRAATTAATLCAWWETYQAGRPPLAIALAALATALGCDN